MYGIAGIAVMRDIGFNLNDSKKIGIPISISLNRQKPKHVSLQSHRFKHSPDQVIYEGITVRVSYSVEHSEVVVSRIHPLAHNWEKRQLDHDIDQLGLLIITLANRRNKIAHRVLAKVKRTRYELIGELKKWKTTT